MSSDQHTQALVYVHERNDHLLVTEGGRLTQTCNRSPPLNPPHSKSFPEVGKESELRSPCSRVLFGEPYKGAISCPCHFEVGPSAQLLYVLGDLTF